MTRSRISSTSMSHKEDFIEVNNKTVVTGLLL